MRRDKKGEERQYQGADAARRRRRSVRLLCSPGVWTVTYVPFGTGIVRFSPYAFVVVNEVSSALCFGIVMAGGNSRRVSLKTL